MRDIVNTDIRRETNPSLIFSIGTSALSFGFDLVGFYYISKIPAFVENNSPCPVEDCPPFIVALGIGLLGDWLCDPVPCPELDFGRSSCDVVSIGLLLLDCNVTSVLGMVTKSEIT